MSVHIDAREVLKYLNDLGYVDISQKQLKEFIRDLKRLIKYDQRNSRKENICPEQDQYYDCEYPSAEDIATQINLREQQEYLSEVFNYLHRASTASSSAKIKNKNVQSDDKVISVEILKPKPSRPLSSTGTSDNRINEEVLPQKPKRPFSFNTDRTRNVLSKPKSDKAHTSSIKTKQKPIKAVTASDSSSTKLNEAQNRPISSRNRNIVPDSAETTRFGRKSPEMGRKPFSFQPAATHSPPSSENSVSPYDSPNFRKKTTKVPKNADFNLRTTNYSPTENSLYFVYPPPNTRKTSWAPRSTDLDLRPTTTFIRPRKPARISKSDPVALYQQYQEEWKKQKLPGEDRRFDLRWAIRERMLGDPEILPRIGMEKASRKSSRS